MEEDIELLKEKINNGYIYVNCGNFVNKAIENILNELEKLEKEFKAVDHECSRLEQKETELEKENENLREHNHNLIKQNRKDKDFLLNRLDKLENALNSEKTVQKCLHCNEDTPLYCEKCQQELITKNAELQLENNQLKRKIFDLYNSSGEYEKAKSIMTKELRDYIPKQVLRDKIEELEEEKLCFYSDYAIEERNCKIEVLKELLGGNENGNNAD